MQFFMRRISVRMSGAWNHLLEVMLRFYLWDEKRERRGFWLLLSFSLLCDLRFSSLATLFLPLLFPTLHELNPGGGGLWSPFCSGFALKSPHALFRKKPTRNDLSLTALAAASLLSAAWSSRPGRERNLCYIHRYWILLHICFITSLFVNSAQRR